MWETNELLFDNFLYELVSFVICTNNVEAQSMAHKYFCAIYRTFRLNGCVRYMRYIEHFVIIFFSCLQHKINIPEFLSASEITDLINPTLREKFHYFSIILIIDTPKSIIFCFFSTSITTIINKII
jgi:hypothetical protein